MVGVRRKCPTSKECVHVTLHVDSDRPGTDPDGSSAHPFGSIAAALDAAAAQHVCGVSVVAAPGTYAGDLVITRDTSIIGAVERRRPQVVIRGSLESDGAYDLSIYGVAFIESPRAAIRVSNPCAYTVVQAISIESASDFGIDIDGGAFAANDVLVASTRGTITVIASGLGIRIQGGAQAAMSEVELTDNDGGGFTVVGETTRAYARRFTVSRNRVVGGLFSVIAAVSSDRALLLMEGSVIEDNEYIGLLGAARSRIHFRVGEITGTRRSELPVFLGREGGVNAFSHNNSILELHTFKLANGALAGEEYVLGGTGISTDGEVSGNLIGVSLVGSMFPMACITRDVYFDNVKDFDGDAIPLPDVRPPDLKVATPLATPEMSEPVCSIAPVPFVCDWCTDG